MSKLEVFEWFSYACNNSSDHRLIATFKSSKEAKAMAKELHTLFETHAEQVQEAQDEEGDWDPNQLDPSPALIAFAKKYKDKFEEGLMWGDEGCSPEDLPEVTTLDKTLVLYHGYMSGGFDGDLPRLLTKAGAATVATEGGPPWLKFTARAASKPKAKAMNAALAELIDQREEHDNLCDFTTPWGGELPIESTVDNVVYLSSEMEATFTLAMGPDECEACQEWLKENFGAKVRVELIGDAEIESLHKEEVGGQAGDAGTSLLDPTGKSFVFTGKLASMSRAEAQAKVEEFGGKIANSVSKTLDVLVIGDEGSPLFGNGKKGSKHIKADKLIAEGSALQIISETDFLALRPAGSGAPKSEAVAKAKTAATTIQIPQTAPKLHLVRSRAQGYEQTTNYLKGMVSYKGMLYATTGQKIIRSEDGATWQVVRNQADHCTFENVGSNAQRIVGGEYGYDGIATHDGRLWVCAAGIALESEDGESWTSHAFNTESPVSGGIVAGNEEGIWISGYDLYLRKKGSDNFEALKCSGKAYFHSMLPSPYGMLFCRDNGNVLYGNKGKLKKAELRAKSPVYNACMTASGALLVVGHGDWSGAIYRSTDGQEFSQSSLPTKVQMHGIVCLPDGRLIAGADKDTLLVSFDDGQTFEAIEHDYVGKSDGNDGNSQEYPRSFGLMCLHQGAAIVTGPFQALLRIE